MNPIEDGQLSLSQDTLVTAWAEQLPIQLHDGDRAEVKADENDPQGVRIHIQAAGHSEYSFDFACTYVDDREVKVELIDVEKGHRTIDERTETVQELVNDYIRHIHECAQALKTDYGQRRNGS